MLVLRPVNAGDKACVMDYKAEFLNSGDNMDGTAGLQFSDSFENWLEAQLRNSREETVLPGRVPATTFLAFRPEDGRLVGMIDVRHRLNDFLLQYGGHIGYSVRASERRKGYASEMLQQALGYCREMGICDVLVTCSVRNPGSEATIRKNGGVLENIVQEGEDRTMRFWISSGETV